jgi:tRNA(Ile)-lysidine synthase
MTGPAPEVAAVRSAVRAALADLSPGARLLVACSGGPDSLALAAAIGFVAPREGWLAGAVVVDHGWQQDSAAVADRAAGACRSLGLAPVEVVAVQPEHGSGGPEAIARRARYAALDLSADRHGVDAVLLGHTLDDQAETVLLGLARGSGGRSLAGMPAARGRYRRPLLGLDRAVTQRACAALGLTPWQDPANTDPAYTRSRLRAVMPVLAGALGPGLPQSLARTAELLAEDAEALDAAAAELLDRADAPDGLDVALLMAAPAAIRRRALLAAARRAGAPAGSVGRSHVLALDALLVDWHGQGAVSLPGGLEADRDCGRLRVAPRALPAVRTAADPTC